MQHDSYTNTPAGSREGKPIFPTNQTQCSQQDIITDQHSPQLFSKTLSIQIVARPNFLCSSSKTSILSQTVTDNVLIGFFINFCPFFWCKSKISSRSKWNVKPLVKE